MTLFIAFRVKMSVTPFFRTGSTAYRIFLPKC